MNGPLQRRTSVLDSDLAVASRLPSDYETDLEKIQEEKESSDNRNLVEQKQLAKKLNREMNEVMRLLTRSLNIHLNVGQHFQVNTSAVFVSLESLSRESLAKKEIPIVGNALLHLPSMLNISLNDTSTASLRVRLHCSRSSLSSCLLLVLVGTFTFFRSFFDEFVSNDFVVVR